MLINTEFLEGLMLLNFDPLKISIDAIAMLFILISEYFLSFILYLEMLFLS